MLISFKSIMEDMLHEKTRVFLTILAIAFGTFAISSMLAIGEGLRLTFSKAVESVGHNLLKISGDRTSKNFRGLHANATFYLTDSDLQAVKVIEEVQDVTGVYWTSGRMFFNDESTTTQIKAVTPNYIDIMQGKISAKIKNGRFINALDIKNNSYTIVLGSRAYEELFKKHGDSVLGEVVNINNKNFKVVGVMEKKAQLLAPEDPEDYCSFIPASTYEMLSRPKWKIDLILVTYKEGADAEAVKNKVQRVLAMNHGVDPDDSSILDFSDASRGQEMVINFFIGMQAFLGIVGLLTLIISGVGISNVMYAAVTRATKEIGLRMAIGARAYQVAFHYIVESMVATAVGGAIGMIMTLLLIFVINNIPMSGKLIDILGRPKPVLSLLVLTIIITILGIIGFLSGLFPAMKAARIDPSTALACGE